MRHFYFMFFPKILYENIHLLIFLTDFYYWNHKEVEKIEKTILLLLKRR